jgi:hypothetical protein
MLPMPHVFIFNLFLKNGIEQYGVIFNPESNIRNVSPICPHPTILGDSKLLSRVSCSFQTGQSRMKLLTEHENATQNGLFGNAVLIALISGRKYGVILQYGNHSGESNVHI